MKSQILQFIFYALLLILLCGLQSSFYLLPIPAPALWFIVYCHYSYNKPVLTALLLNLILTVILVNFSVGNGGILLGSLNFSTLILKSIKNRLHISDMQTILTTGIGCFLFFFLIWMVNRFFNGLYYPHISSWFGTSLVTFMASPFILFPLDKVEKLFLTDTSHTLKDLRL